MTAPSKFQPYEGNLYELPSSRSRRHSDGAQETTGDGGGTMPPMERRLSEVEKAIIRIDASLTHIQADLTEVKGNVKNWKWQILVAGLSVALAMWGGFFAIQQMTVATFVAASQQQREAQAAPTWQRDPVVAPSASSPAWMQAPVESPASAPR